MIQQKRRGYTREFREEAVKLISKQGDSYAEAGRNLAVNPKDLGNRWLSIMQLKKKKLSIYT